MSRTIDERVVSMQFDNKQFENNVQTSLGTLEKLKQGLNFTGAVKGLETVDSAAKGINFSPLSSAVDAIGTKFSAMQVMAVTALANITNSAVNAGKRIASALTIEPVKSGFQEYETQINSVQTILANTQSKGSTLEDVNTALDELNAYADKTIYNFTEMTRNIGTFTAAGVELDKSVSSIKGIANLAAVSGSTSQQASTAMYQLSQALAAGKVQLMDWNSVVNAGMGGQVFQDALKRTAKAMGTNVDEMIKQYGSFRESLTKGQWLTADVLTETLTQLSGAYTEADLLAKGYTKEQAKEILDLADTAVNAATKVKTFTQLVDTIKEAAQSGWTQTWEIIVGDFEEARALWTQVSDVIGGFLGESAEARNTMLEGAMTSNWDKLIKKINDAGIKTDIFEKKLTETAKAHDIDVDALVKKHGSIEEAFRSGAISSDILKEAVNDLSTSFGKLGDIEKNLKMGSAGEDVTKVQEALKAMGYDLGEWGVDGKFGAATEAAVKAFQAAQGLEVTGIIDEKTIEALEKAGAAADKLKGGISGLIAGIDKLGGRELVIEGFKNIFNGLLSVIKPIKRAFEEVFPPITSEQLYKLLEGFKNLTERFKLTTPQIRKVYSAFKGFFSIIDIGWTFIKELAGGIWSLLGNFSGLGDGILGIVGSIGDYFTGLRQSVKETGVFGTIIGNVTGFIQSCIDRIREFGKSISSGFKAPELEGVYSLFKGIWEILKTIGGAVGDVFSSLVSGISEAFQGGGVDGFFTALNGGLFTSILLGIRKFIEGDLADLLNIPKGVFESIGDALDTLKGALESWQQDLQANTLLKIAGAIGILAVAVLILASINPERLGSALAGITALFIELVGALSIINKTGGINKGITKAMVAMVGMSVAILILATALKKISSLSWEELAVGIVGIMALTGVVVAAAKILGKDKKTVIKGATSMVIFAAAIKILAGVCKDLAALSWDEMIKGLVGVGALVGMVSIFLTNTKSNGKMISSAVGILILSGAIKVLASACADFGQMGWEEIGKGLVAIGALLVELSLFTKLTGGAKNMISTGTGIVLLAASMKIFASAVSDFSQMSWEDIGRGLAGMAGSLILVTAAVKLMPKNMLATGIGLAVVAGSLIVLSTALSDMSSMSWDEVGKGLFAMAGALLAVTLAVNMMPKNMIGVGLGLAVVSGALLLLSNVLGKIGGMSWTELSVGLTGLGGALLVLVLALNMMQGTVAGSAALLIASVALGAIAGALKILGEMSVWGIIKALLALAGAFAIIGVSAVVLGALSPIIIALGGAFLMFGAAILGIGVGLMAISAGISALAAVGVVGAAAFIGALSVIITGVIDLIPAIASSIGKAIVAICAVITESAPAIAEAAVAVILSLIDVLVECVPQLADGVFKIISALLSALAEYTPGIIDSLFQFIIGVLDGVSANLPALITAGLEVFSAFVTGILDGLGGVFESLGNALGSVIGGIVEGLLQGISESLPDIGTNLSTFMTNLGPFIEGVKGLDESTIAGMTALVDMIATLTGAGLMDAIATFISGESTLLKFAEDIVPFGFAIKAFSLIVSGIDESAVAAAANAGSMLSSMADTIPKSGGVLQFFTGTYDMAKFAEQIVPFGTAIKSFSDEVTGIDETAITAAANAGAALTAMAATIPETGGIFQVFSGTHDMVKFGEQIVPFGKAMKEFSNAVTGIDESAVTAAANAGAALGAMAGSLPETGGVWSWFSGTADMETFGTQLKSFGTGIQGFSDEVKNLDQTAVTGAATAATRLIEVANSIPVEKLTPMVTLGQNAKKMGAYIKEFYAELVDVDNVKLFGAVNMARKLASLASEISGISFDSFASFGNSLNEIGKNGVEGFIKAFTDSEKAVTDAGNGLITQLLDGAQKKADESLVTSFESIASNVITAIRDKYEGFYNAGKYVVDGFATGITDQTWKAEAKATAMANAAEKAAKEALKVNSPSKVFIPLGEAIPEGLALGIDRLGYTVKNSSVSVAKSALDGTKNAISRIADIINSDIDAQPTIRPVLDLSAVSAGAGAIGGMFDMSPSVGVMANLSSISSTMNGRQNGGNDDVISAIKDLGKAIGDMHGDTYSINGVTYDDGSNISEAVKSLVRAARMERRI